MPETWASANARRSCLDCGESDAGLYTYGPEDARINTRVCNRCVGRWSQYRLVPREPVYQEARP